MGSQGQSLWNPSINPIRGDPQRDVREVGRKPEGKVLKGKSSRTREWSGLKARKVRLEKGLLALVTLTWLPQSGRRLRSEEELKNISIQEVTLSQCWTEAGRGKVRTSVGS